MIAETDRVCYVGPAMMPDGQGGWQPVPPVMTDAECIRYLRIDTLEVKNPKDTLSRLIELGHLRPTPISNRNFFTPEECDRCLRQRTEWYDDAHKQTGTKTRRKDGNYDDKDWEGDVHQRRTQQGQPVGGPLA